jgi:hypothetical protein
MMVVNLWQWTGRPYSRTQGGCTWSSLPDEVVTDIRDCILPSCSPHLRVEYLGAELRLEQNYNTEFASWPLPVAASPFSWSSPPSIIHWQTMNLPSSKSGIQDYFQTHSLLIDYLPSPSGCSHGSCEQLWLRSPYNYATARQSSSIIVIAIAFLQ